KLCRRSTISTIGTPTPHAAAPQLRSVLAPTGATRLRATLSEQIHGFEKLAENQGEIGRGAGAISLAGGGCEVVTGVRTDGGASAAGTSALFAQRVPPGLPIRNWAGFPRAR